ncbi:hypothetical protein ABAZ39_14795 (plasmid) [Azospirillum argentinense]|uniref:Uncharacterized protein n=1 Tax=Azospirillum argentinense TaxID=2970906 RepID=A0A060DPW8_9PROT|nr:hypothetical protein [Azospirillum argentinense]AIB13228.1 hypothetical protein ABAZ39_14795 [Azospirillum argentinense]EZQ06388.1 hypothetical protein ABAZ39_14790 [Azospirillum argentinense]
MSPVFDISLPKEEVGAFRGTLQTYHLGGALLGRCASVTQTFHRTTQVITRSGIDHYLIQVRIGDDRNAVRSRTPAIGQ